MSAERGRTGTNEDPDTMRTPTISTDIDTDPTDGAGDTARLDDPVTDEYLEGLRAALADLPAEEVGEIVADARAHLVDLAGELGEGYDRDAVHARLGTPAAYAAELRTAAGFPAPPATTTTMTSRRRSVWAARFAVTGLGGATAVAGLGGLADISDAAGSLLFLALVAAGIGVLPIVGDGPRLPSVAALDSVRAIARWIRPDGARAQDIPAFVARLQPGWWLLRAAAAAGVLAVLFTGGGPSAVWVTVVIAVVAVPVSVALGSRTRADRRLLWAVVPLNAFAATVVVSAGLTLAGTDDATGTPWPMPGLAQDGRAVTDVRPFDSAGRPLSGVYLFDQDGRPLTVQDRAACLPAAEAQNRRSGPFPLGDRTTDPATGACITNPPEPMVVTLPGASPAPTTPRPTS